MEISSEGRGEKERRGKDTLGEKKAKVESRGIAYYFSFTPWKPARLK